MIITIDGPAGSGKSTISKIFAEKINYRVIDTGSMYRAIAYLFKESQLDIDSKEFRMLIESMDLFIDHKKVILNNKDISLYIRTPDIDMITSKYISTNSFIRQKLSQMQREMAKFSDIVAEGRDMGSVIFPDAHLKFYLTASPIIRAERRQKQLKKSHLKIDLKALEKEIKERDNQDMTRTLNPLCIPDKAIIIDSDYLTHDQVLEKLLYNYYKMKTISSH